jgi:hypothetical protein
MVDLNEAAKRPTQPNPKPGVASFLLPGESYLSLILKKLGATR